MSDPTTSPARILVVCTANICRSPMAEALLQAYVDRHGPPGRSARITSAGTHAQVGLPPAGAMLRIAGRWGLDLSAHRARRTDLDLVRAHDLVLTMEARQRDAVARLAPGAAQRTFLVNEVDALLDHVEVPGDRPDDRLAALVRALQQARARVPIHVDDVLDPYGGPEDGYEATAWQLADLVGRLGPVLASTLPAA